jgi:Zn-dependent metalloprotease
MYNSIPVEAGEIILHLRDNAVYLANGEIVSGLKANTSPSISEDAAFRKALEYFPAALYRWEHEGRSRPKGELFLIDKNFSKNAQAYRLSWKFDIHSASPEERNWVYIDAENGDLNLA